MKAFFERYSYDCVRMLLDQIAISMFGFALAMTATRIESENLLLWSSIASIIFYLVLIYGVAWKRGSDDKQSIGYGKIKYNPFLGMILSAIANSINFIVAIIITVGTLTGFENVWIFRTVALLGQGMYQGLLAKVTVGGLALNNYWWAYLLIPIPAMLISLIGYIAGAKDLHVTGAGMSQYPASDRPSRQELKEQRELEKKSRK